MLAEIENGIIARLKDKAPDVTYLDIPKGQPVLPKNAAYMLAIMSGPAESLTHSNDEKQIVEIYLWLAFKNIKSDKDRRHGAFPVLEALAQLLVDQKLALQIKGIKYTGFTDVTDQEERSGGMAIYQLTFKTSYVVTKLDEEGAQQLLSVGLNYLLNGSDIAAAQDLVTLRIGE